MDAVIADRRKVMKPVIPAGNRAGIEKPECSVFLREDISAGVDNIHLVINIFPDRFHGGVTAFHIFPAEKTDIIQKKLNILHHKLLVTGKKAPASGGLAGAAG